MIKGSSDDSNPTILTAGSDGRVVEWTVADGSTRVVQGEGHGAQINGLCSVGGTQLATVGIDDSLKIFDQVSGKYESGLASKLSGQPKGIDHKGDLTLVSTINSLTMVSTAVQHCKTKITYPFFGIVYLNFDFAFQLRNNQVVHETKVNFEPSAISILNDEEFAVGESSGGNTVYIYGVTGDGGMEERKKIALSGAVTDLCYSPDGSYLVTSDGNRKVTLFSVANDYQKATTREWGFHTAKVNCVAWSPNSLFVASGAC